MKPVVALNVCDPRWKRRRQAAAEPELLAERDRVALLRQQGVRTGVDRETIDLLAQDDATRPFGAFDHGEGDATRLQFVRGRQPRDAAADDCNIDSHSRCRTMSSSAP